MINTFILVCTICIGTYHVKNDQGEDIKQMACNNYAFLFDSEDQAQEGKEDRPSQDCKIYEAIELPEPVISTQEDK